MIKAISQGVANATDEEVDAIKDVYADIVALQKMGAKFYEGNGQMSAFEGRKCFLDYLLIQVGEDLVRFAIRVG